MSVSVHFVSYGLSLTIKGMWHLYTDPSKLIHTDLESTHIYSKPASTCPSLLIQRRDRVETNTATSSSSYIILIIISIVPDHKQCIHSNPHSLLSTLKTPLKTPGQGLRQTMPVSGKHTLDGTVCKRIHTLIQEQFRVVYPCTGMVKGQGKKPENSEEPGGAHGTQHRE